LLATTCCRIGSSRLAEFYRQQSACFKVTRRRLILMGVVSTSSVYSRYSRRSSTTISSRDWQPPLGRTSNQVEPFCYTTSSTTIHRIQMCAVSRPAEFSNCFQVQSHESTVLLWHLLLEGVSQSCGRAVTRCSMLFHYFAAMFLFGWKKIKHNCAARAQLAVC
jgi:hypothetical protein